MITTRRELMAGGLAAVAAAAGGVPVWAAEEASSYFAGTAADNGVSYRTTNFRKINKKWHKQVVKYFSRLPMSRGSGRYGPQMRPGAPRRRSSSSPLTTRQGGP